MRIINFIVDPSVPDSAIPEVVVRLEQVRGVRHPQLLDPDSPALAVRRLGHAYVDDDSDIAEVVRNVTRMAGIEEASEPAPRFLS